MNMREQRIAVWLGPTFLALFLSGLLCAGFIPPMGPTVSAGDVVAFYAANFNMIRLGMALQITGASFQIFFVAAITAQLLRIPGNSRVFAYTQLAAGAVNTILFLLSPVLWSVAAYRFDRSPEIVLALNDIGWLLFVVPFSPALTQCFALGGAILLDAGKRPIFPRWVGYFNFWVGMLFVPSVFAIFFKNGPFAWNGILAFWMPASVMGVWFAVMTVMLLRAISEQERTAAAGTKN